MSRGEWLILASELLRLAARRAFRDAWADPVGRIDESVGAMSEFLSNYGLWIVLGGIFVAMHLFGMGCCGGGHDHVEKRKDERPGAPADPNAPAPTIAGATPTRSRPGGCH
jgi:hypothetical protein